MPENIKASQSREATSSPERYFPLISGGMAGMIVSGHPAAAVFFSTIILCYLANRSGLDAEHQRQFWRRSILMLVTVMIVTIMADGIISNWADFKSGFVEGWKTFQ